MPYRKAYDYNQSTRAHDNRLQEWLLLAGPYGSALLGLSAILLIWLGAFYFTSSEKTQIERAAIHNAENLSRAFEEQIIRSIRAADQTLLYARDVYAKDPFSFDMSLWTYNSQFLTDINFQVVIIDKKGVMVSSNIPGSKPGLDLSDREHFRVHADSDLDDLFISKPVLGRVTNKWSIQLTRRITMPDGTFGGVAVVSLDPEYLSKFYESIDVGQKGSVALVGVDGIVRARGAKGPSTIGQSVSGGQLMREFVKAKAGNYSSVSQLDGIERMSVYREVRGYPLIVVVGLAKDEVFSAYDESRRQEINIAIFLTLWLLGVTYLMARYQRVLARARDAAEAGTRARSEFLAMMSHEIRTPMNGVVGMSEVLLESGLNSEQMSFARTLGESARHLLQVINDVLDFSKLEANRVSIEQIPFGLHQLVRDTVGVLQTNATEKGLWLSVEISQNVPVSVVGDPAHLRQVILNLVGNGIKFTKTGGVTVHVDAQPDVRAGRIRLLIAIADTGIGIPDDGLPLLFREFSQLDSSIARRFGGTGLGLAICKRLVDLMGGSIVVESEVGKGTTFRFTVDCLLDSAVNEDGIVVFAPASTPSLVPGANPESVRVLLVEDNKTNQLVAIKLLERIGYSVDVANSGVEAVAACQSVAYDLVFMDIMMPEMDGLTATRAIRKLDKPCCDAYIIALTANAQKHDSDMCAEAGMNDFLPKPVTRQNLISKLNRFQILYKGAKAVPAGLEQVLTLAAPGIPKFDAGVYAELEGVLGPQDMQLVVYTFLQDAEACIATMRECAGHQDNEGVKRQAHGVKSSAANLGFLHFSDVCRLLEKDSLGLSWPALSERINAVSGAFDDIRPIAIAKLSALAAVTA